MPSYHCDMSPREKGHVDIYGDTDSVVNGAAQWEQVQIRDTGVYGNFLRTSQDDYFQSKIELDHNVGPETVFDDLHIHYILSEVPAAGSTMVIDWRFTIVPIGKEIPALTEWNTATTQVTFTGGEKAWCYYYDRFAINVSPPVGNAYSSVVYIRGVHRGTPVGHSTYTGKIGLMAIGIHVLSDRKGSKFYNTDIV